MSCNESGLIGGRPDRSRGAGVCTRPCHMHAGASGDEKSEGMEEEPKGGWGLQRMHARLICPRAFVCEEECRRLRLVTARR